MVAEGIYAGAHRSARRGAGVEFGGFREYTPGDDLRWVDRRSLLRHDHLLIRQFETETERAFRSVVDATASMSYRGTRAPCDKLAYASLVAAACTRVAIGSGDPVGLSYIGGRLPSVPVGGGREAFERIVSSLEAVEPGFDATVDAGAVERAVSLLARSARRGSMIVVLSDFIDLPPLTEERLAALTTRGRVVVLVQVLDPDERDFPFSSAVRLRALEGTAQVETDPSVRESYLAALHQHTARYEHAITARGGRFLSVSTSDDPVDVVRAIAQAARI